MRTHIVVVEQHGTEGCQPKYQIDCPVWKDDGEGAPSCISGSGGSICGGYAGHAANPFTINCQFYPEDPVANWPRTWERVNQSLHRLKVPGGWLVDASGTEEVALCFYPDDMHEWILESVEEPKL